MNITKRNRRIRQIAETIAHQDGIEATHTHYADMADRDDNHGQNCCHHAYEDAARNTYHHLASRCAYRSPTGCVYLAIGLPALQRMLSA